MKKYQLWLERKSYSQHLFNLMKIKHASVADKQEHVSLSPKFGPVKQNTKPSKYRAKEDCHTEAQKLGDVSYAITYRQLKNRKMRIMKTFQIVNQNINMARRLKEVKSAFNPNKDKNSISYGKRRMLQNKFQHSNEQLRSQNFRKFIKWQNNRVGPHHKYKLTITIETISKFISARDEYAAFRCEIYADKEFTKSEMVQLTCFNGHQFLFPLENELTKDFTLRLYMCKGLESEMIGQYQILKPDLGETLERQYKSDDHRSCIQVKLLYQKISRQRLHLTVK